MDQFIDTNIIVDPTSANNINSNLNGAPVPVPEVFPFLRIKSTGEILPYNPSFASRGDLVEGVYDMNGSTTPPSQDELDKIAEQRAEAFNNHVPLVGNQSVNNTPFDQAAFVDSVVEKVVTILRELHVITNDRLTSIEDTVKEIHASQQNQSGGSDGLRLDSIGNNTVDNKPTVTTDGSVNSGKETTDNTTKKTSESSKKKSAVNPSDYA